MLKKQTAQCYSNNTEETTPKRFSRPLSLPTSGKNESITGVTIKQVKEMLHSEDLTQVVKLFDLMVQRDLHLAATLSSRRDQLQSLEYSIEGADTEVLFATNYLDNIEFNLLLQDLSSSLEYGFSVLDMTWGMHDIDGKTCFVPQHKLLSARYFSYDNKKKSDREALLFSIDNRKRYLSSYDNRKVLLHLHKTDTEHITRYSPLYKAAWFIALKHQVIASNMNWYDSLGVPPLIINQDTADQKDLEHVLYQALSLRSNAVGIFPKDVDAKLLTEGVGSKADFLSFINYIDKQVSFFITGQTMATTSDGKGSHALAKEHANRLVEKQTFDAKLIARSITQMLNLIIEQNIATPSKVKFKFIIKEQRDLKTASEVIKNLEGSGFEIPADHVSKTFGIEGVKRKESGGLTSDNLLQRNELSAGLTPTTPTRTRQTNDATPNLALDKTAAQIEKMDLNDIEEELIARLTAAILESDSYEEALDILADDESIDHDKLEALLTQYIANANMQGLDDGGH